MKKYLWIILISTFLVIPIASIINFFTNNNFKSGNDLNQIVNPSRGWPAKNATQLSIWQFLYTTTQQQLVESNDRIVRGYSDFYLSEFYKYRDSEEENAGKPGYDEIGIPTVELDQYFEKNIVLSYEMQKFMALSVRLYFIELTINQITNSANNINPNEYLNLWVMKYFQAGFYFQWVKIWIQDLGRTVEKSINIYFYTYGSLVPRDQTGNQIWSKGPDSSSQQVVPLLKLDRVITTKSNEIYQIVLGGNQ